MYEQIDKLKREFKAQMIEYLIGLVVAHIAIAFFFYWDNWFTRLFMVLGCVVHGFSDDRYSRGLLPSEKSGA